MLKWRKRKVWQNLNESDSWNRFLELGWPGFVHAGISRPFSQTAWTQPLWKGHSYDGRLKCLRLSENWLRTEKALTFKWIFQCRLRESRLLTVRPQILQACFSLDSGVFGSSLGLWMGPNWGVKEERVLILVSKDLIWVLKKASSNMGCQMT